VNICCGLDGFFVFHFDEKKKEENRREKIPLALAFCCLGEGLA
jgi:hypothetical protein